MFAQVELLDFVIDLGLEEADVLKIADTYENIFTIRYEDLLNDFRKTVSRLCHFCGLEINDDIIQQIEDRTSFKYLSETNPGFYRKGIIGEHLNYMTNLQIDRSVHRILARAEYYATYF